MSQDAKLITYIKAKMKQQLLTCSGDKHPQRALQRSAAPYKSLWSSHPIDCTKVDDYLHWVPEGGYPCDLPVFYGPHLQSKACAAGKSEPGLDGITAKMLSRLPDEFWESLAALYNCILHSGSPLPWQFKHLRTHLIPKPDKPGTHRDPALILCCFCPLEAFRLSSSGHT